MSNLLAALVGLSTGFISVPVQIRATFTWLFVWLLHEQWLILKGWCPGGMDVTKHPWQPRLPRMTPKTPVEASGEVVKWERPEKEYTFVSRRPEDGEYEQYQVYTLVCRSEKLRKSFRRLFRQGGRDRYVFWNMGVASHQIFHFGEGHQLPERIDPSALLICCHPELLPPHLREQHLFPNGTGPVHVSYGMTNSEEGYFLAQFACRVK